MILIVVQFFGGNARACCGIRRGRYFYAVFKVHGGLPPALQFRSRAVFSYSK
jgi:hypothetical protein